MEVTGLLYSQWKSNFNVRLSAGIGDVIIRYMQSVFIRFMSQNNF